MVLVQTPAAIQAYLLRTWNCYFGTNQSTNSFLNSNTPSKAALHKHIVHRNIITKYENGTLLTFQNIWLPRQENIDGQMTGWV